MAELTIIGLNQTTFFNDSGRPLTPDMISTAARAISRYAAPCKTGTFRPV